MKAEFWHEMWARESQGFHEEKGNAMLARFAREVWPEEIQRIFIPLCGRTRDIAWCLSQGWSVVGAELSQAAIEALFEDLGVVPKVLDLGRLRRYSAPQLDVYVGDVFDVSADTLGSVTGVFDRAALVALPEQMRRDYARHLVEITGGAQQLLITFDYDQSAMDGPPFSVPSDFVEDVYAPHYKIQPLESTAVPGMLKGRVAAQEEAWHLIPCA